MIYALKIFRSPEKADGKQPQSHHWPPLVFNNFRAFAYASERLICVRLAQKKAACLVY